MFLLGNEALALGAIAAGSRFMASYPITPASEVMEYMIKKMDHIGATVVQTEDEIAACMTAMGGVYAAFAVSLVLPARASALWLNPYPWLLWRNFLCSLSMYNVPAHPPVWLLK